MSRIFKKRKAPPEAKPKGSLPQMPTLAPPSVDDILDKIEEAFEEEETEACGCWGRA